MPRSLVTLALALVACARGGGAGSDAAPDTSGPVDAAIDANECSVQPCSILPQCGCVGQTACDIDANDNMGTACRSVLEKGREDSACVGLDRCDKGYVCLGSQTYATCKKYCETDTDCGTPRGRCAIDISSGGMTLMDIPSACSSNCDPLPTTQPPECPPSSKCGLFTTTHDGAQVKITSCAAAGARTQGESCQNGTSGNEALCARGYLCTTINAGASFECRRICNRTANTGCGALTCIGFNPAHTVDIEYGVCN